MIRLEPADRSRSPRFPSHSLDQAIVLARKIYDGVHRSSVDSMSAMQLMGFAGKSGASSTALGSIRQFGLIEGTGDRTRISDLALKILEPIDDQERAEAVNEAAAYPQVFGQILARFDGRLPTADEPLRAYLIRELGFSKSGADDCLTSIRKTLEFSHGYRILARPEVEVELLADRPPPEESKLSASNSLQGTEEGGANSSYGQSSEHMVIPLTRECRASLQFHGLVTDKAIGTLLKHIELMREVWMED